MLFYRPSLLTLAILGLTACSSSSDKDFQELAKQSLEQQVNWHSEQTAAVDVVQLTDLIHIPALNAVIQQAMKNNPSLQQRLMALKMLYAQRTATNSDRIPELSANFGGNKEESSDTAYNTDLTVSWELDLWNKIGNSTRAADKDIASNIATLQSTKDTLAANIMRGWLQISLQKQLLDIEVKRLVVLESNESMILEKYRSGLGDLEDLDTAKADSAYSRSTLAEYNETLAQNQRSLTLLLGLLGDEQRFNVSAEFPQVLTPLVSLPKQDLSRRPDLQSALFDIEAEEFRTKAAYKARLPSLSLEIALSDVANSPSAALLTSPLWSVLGQLSAPLFDGGYLRSKAEIAELTTESAYWNYQDTLLTAVNEVENALGQEKSLTLQQKHLQDARDSAARSLSSYQGKYRQGLVDISDLITVQTGSFDVETKLVQAKYNRLVNRIDLGLALGLGVSL
ncbi:MAG: NodT family efflux transporter outer membrane factor (OMF) lipoprotein [Psychromonas sp.]|jgi:NodT family efflux transporter outer membrane factor (OMF) lipoprotein|uniref:TolC family protein n=1 Tax=Psychromonas sp. TaxID=1884585 RepID=UPI0039E517F1